MSSSLLIPGGTQPAADGNVISITPERAGWHHVGFDRMRRRQQHRCDEPWNRVDRGDGYFGHPDAYDHGDSDRSVIGSEVMRSRSPAPPCLSR